MSNNTLSITRLQLENFMRFHEYEVDFDKGVNIISGRNGEGKTSIIKAMQAVLGGGTKMERLLKVGEDKGEAILYLGDDSVAMRTFSNKGTNIKYYDRLKEEVPKAAQVIKEFVDPFSLNPAQFLSATDNERIDILKDMLSAKPEDSKIGEILSKLLELDNSDDLKLHSDNVFEDIDRLEKTVASYRASYKKTRDQRKATVKSLEESAQGTDIDAAGTEKIINEAKAELDRLNESKSEELDRLSEREKQKAESIKTAFDEKEKSLREMLMKIQKQIDVNEKEKETRLNEIERFARDEKDQILDKYRSQTDSVKEKLAENEQMLKHYHSQQGMREALDRELAYYKEAEAAAAICEKAISELREERKRLMGQKLPKGLTIEDGTLYYDGIAYDTLNTQQKIDVAVRLALVRSKGTGVLFVDGFEALDHENREVLLKRLAETKCQCFVAEVSEEDLTIKPYRPEPEAELV